MKTVTVELTVEELETLIDMADAGLSATPDCPATDVERVALAKLRSYLPEGPS